MILIGRLAVAWTTVALFFLFGDAWLADLASGLRAALFFLWLFIIILWCAFGVVEQADHLADMLGDPLGSLVLTLSIVIIEVVLIAAVAIGSDATPTLGRDTMFGVLMIALNGGVGLALLMGGLHHREQAYNLQGAVAYLAVIIPGPLLYHKYYETGFVPASFNAKVDALLEKLNKLGNLTDEQFAQAKDTKLHFVRRKNYTQPQKPPEENDEGGEENDR